MGKGTFKVGWLVGWLGLVVLLIWQGPQLHRAWEINRMALAAMEVCTGEKALSELAGAPAFLRAGAAHCLGDEAMAHILYLETVGPDTRIAVLHAARPADVELAKRVAMNHPDRAEAYFWLGEALLGGVPVWQVPTQTLVDSADLLEAITAYEGGLAFAPTDGEEWDNLGRLYQAAGMWEKAALAFDKACQFEDDGRNGCLNAGRVYMQLAWYEQALARYQDSLRLLPDYPSSSLKGIANALIALGRTAEAIPYLETLANEGDVEAQDLLAQIQATP